MSLCLIEGRAPVGQLKACSTEKLQPHTQCEGIRVGFQPYRRHNASLKDPLWRAKLCLAMGSATDQERALLELPARLEGLGITNATKTATSNHLKSTRLTKPLMKLIQQREKECPQAVRAEQASINRDIKRNNRKLQQECAKNTTDNLPAKLVRAMEMASEKGASSWVVKPVLPVRAGSRLSRMASSSGWKSSPISGIALCR